MLQDGTQFKILERILTFVQHQVPGAEKALFELLTWLDTSLIVFDACVAVIATLSDSMELLPTFFRSLQLIVHRAGAERGDLLESMNVLEKMTALVDTETPPVSALTGAVVLLEPLEMSALTAAALLIEELVHRFEPPLVAPFLQVALAMLRKITLVNAASVFNPVHHALDCATRWTGELCGAIRDRALQSLELIMTNLRAVADANFRIKDALTILALSTRPDWEMFFELLEPLFAAILEAPPDERIEQTASFFEALSEFSDIFNPEHIFLILEQFSDLFVGPATSVPEGRSLSAILSLVTTIAPLPEQFAPFAVRIFPIALRSVISAGVFDDDWGDGCVKCAIHLFDHFGPQIIAEGFGEEIFDFIRCLGTANQKCVVVAIAISQTLDPRTRVRAIVEVTRRALEDIGARGETALTFIAAADAEGVGPEEEDTLREFFGGVHSICMNSPQNHIELYTQLITTISIFAGPEFEASFAADLEVPEMPLILLTVIAMHLLGTHFQRAAVAKLVDVIDGFKELLAGKNYRDCVEEEMSEERRQHMVTISNAAFVFKTNFAEVPEEAEQEVANLLLAVTHVLMSDVAAIEELLPFETENFPPKLLLRESAAFTAVINHEDRKYTPEDGERIIRSFAEQMHFLIERGESVDKLLEKMIKSTAVLNRFKALIYPQIPQFEEFFLSEAWTNRAEADQQADAEDGL
jgi:hypothetical protein